jgi:hypothetical protein
MTVREFLAELQRLPRDAEVLAFETGCEEYYEREVDDYLIVSVQALVGIGSWVDPRTVAGDHHR